MVPTNYYLILGAMIFTIGAVGVSVAPQRADHLYVRGDDAQQRQPDADRLSRQWNNLNGQIFVFMIMAVAAAEVAVGLAILISHYYHTKTTNIDDINVLKW